MKPEKFNAVFFDLDGVVLKSDPTNRKILKRITKENLQHELTDSDYEIFFAGKSLEEGVRSYLKAIRREDKAEEIIQLKKSSDREYIEEVELYGESVRLIRQLNHKGIVTALATGARWEQFEAITKKFSAEFEGLFDYIVTSKDYHFSKPNPDVYNVLLEKSGFIHSLGEVAVVEDSPAGVQAAKNADLFCIAITNTHTADVLTRAGADKVVVEIEEIIHFLEGLSQHPESPL